MRYTVSDYLNQLVNFDGERLRLFQVIEILEKQTTNRVLIDRYIQGLVLRIPSEGSA